MWTLVGKPQQASGSKAMSDAAMVQWGTKSRRLTLKGLSILHT